MKRKIGLLGLTFTDPNKGCEALTYTFINMLQRIYQNDELEVVCFMRTDELGKIEQFFPNIKFVGFILNIYSINCWIKVYQEIKTCSCVFDASYGDGFTGIYGTRRNFVQALRKQMVISANKPLFLLPQTYGLYKFPFKNWSIGLIKKANLAYARDEMTAKAVGTFVKTTSDLAFGLPFDKNMFPMKNDGTKRFGLNVSSLLWDEETSQRFGLKVDYRGFYEKLLTYLINETDYEVHIIPHVLDIKHPNAPENDYRICEEIKRIYEEVHLAPAFETAIEAKSYICHMDIFLGSRMHSTIGAISSGVTTIPFSYAHKFEALYSNIDYPYVLSATKLSTDEALDIVKTWIAKPQPLQDEGRKAVRRAFVKLQDFEEDLIASLKNNGLL
ncbi:MAG: polysaccharide pyruvyl transferase family protein [Elusimicrobiales bacterium]|nr:polysaccharide pyruvyl transferase family protein [Elusimicrobiales bacterium]